MATEITMPKLSDTMTEGHFGIWLKNVGDRITRGDIIAEVETDKATMDLEAFTSGILLEQRVREGELVPVGAVIGLIGEPGELTAAQAPPRDEPASQAAEVATLSTPAPDASPAPVPHPSPAPVIAHIGEGSVQAAPVIRRLAAEMGIDLDRVTGSGPGGRIMREDLYRQVPAGSGAKVAAPSPPELSEPPGPSEPPESPAPVTPITPVAPAAAQPVSRMRSAIARTTVTSWQNIPHFYLTRHIEMDRAEALVQSLKEGGESASLNALIMAAAASALMRFPVLNSSYGDAGLTGNPHVNLSFAVALDDGLQMPVIKGAEQLGIGEMHAEVARLAERARKRQLTADDIQGGSFGISNLGMHGIDSMASIIMPGQAGILGIGAVAERPVAHDGRCAVARVITVTLSCDHRIIDGVVAADFLNEIKRLLEHPEDLPV